MLAAALLWFGKGIHAGVQVWNSTGSLSASIEPIRSLLAIRGKEVVMRSEPAVTQMILNEIVRTDYYIGPGHLKGVVYQVWPAPSMFGVSSGEFNEIFQADLFPQFRSGLAYNYWAEGMATGGWFMLLAFTALFIMGLLIINALSESPRLSVRCLALLCGAYWAFYIHRNSLGNIIAYERHLLYVGVTLFAIARLIPQKRVWHSMPASSYQENDREFEYFERAFQSDRSGHTAGESL